MIILTLILATLAFKAQSVRVFLMGGAVANNQAQIYTNLAAATGKKPTPNQCSDDWRTTTCPKIAVITSAAATQQDGNYAYNVDETGSLSYKSLYELYGYSPKHVTVHIDNYEKTTDITKPQGQANMMLILQADIIFFNGGDQSRHARAWLNDDGTPNKLMEFIYKRAINNSVILSGTSAGSMIMCSPIYGSGISYGHLYFAAKVGLAPKKVSDGGVNGTGTDDNRNGTKSLQYEDNGGMMPGFNFLPFLVDTHFDNRGRLGRIVPAIVQMKKDFGVGVDESSGFFYDNGKAKVYGKNGAFIVDISKATPNVKSYFGINNVVLSYLTSGDQFDFQKKQIKVQSTKKLIEKPTYSQHTDSTDIFSSYESTKLITRLIDQVPSYNVGRSRIPSGYPRDAPVFKLTFAKDYNTKGFYSSEKKKYAAYNVVVHYTYQ